MAGALAGVMVRAKADATNSVSALASYLTCAIDGDPNSRLASVQSMLDDPRWQLRLLGLIAVRDLPPDKQQGLAGKLSESDPDPVVEQYANAVISFAKMATTQPAATQPAEPMAPVPDAGSPLLPDLLDAPKPPAAQQ
jgi:hypothetical protein